MVKLPETSNYTVLILLFPIVCRKLLSPQKHYDWGLRALKTILGGCGSILRNWWSTSGDNVSRGNDELSKEKEMELAVQALRLNTLSKLLFKDCLSFDHLVRDVFPEIQFISSGHEKLTAVLKESFSALGLQYNDRQVCSSSLQNVIVFCLSIIVLMTLSLFYRSISV